MHLRTGRLIALVCLLALGMLLTALHNRAVEQNRSFPLETAVRSVLSPFQAAIHAVARLGSGVTGSLAGRRTLLRKNKALSHEVLRLSKENARLREEHGENIRLRTLLGFKQNPPGRLLATQVIGRGSSRWHNTITIDRGARDGVRRADPVITPRGLVGQVSDVGPGVSQVLLLTDQASGVGAVIERSRAAGICQGQLSPHLVMNYLNKEDDIKVGDIVVSSGIGGVYPKGIPIGRVIRVKPTDGLMLSAIIRPSVNPERLEEAFVLMNSASE